MGGYKWKPRRVALDLSQFETVRIKTPQAGAYLLPQLEGVRGWCANLIEMASYSRECGKRALWTRMARPVELDSWSNREYNQRVGMSVANGTCVSLVEVGLRVLPIKTLP